ncbi:hypothetical protein TWF481_007934 [Arthrobotrys musiformis]|uniref:Uncharacterized protein n=1 Tax=Arthrobotrys musiformis TaxID=47236 RepID=A0AAV9W5N4_9PEZI
MPAERTTRGVSATGSIRNSRSRRDSCASNSSIPDTGSRPMSPAFRPTSPFGFSPYGNMAPLTPGNSRPGTPSNKRNVARNTRKADSSTQSFTSLLAPPSPPLSADASESNSMDMDPPTITWECANALVENKKVQSFCEKPVYSKTGEVVSYGRIVTKTVTMTITTTIASTEILRPGEEGYEASMEKYRQQQTQQQQIEQHPKNVTSRSNAEDTKFDKMFVEAFSPEDTSVEERRHIFNQTLQNARLQEQLRLAKYNSPSPSPPPVRPTRQE